MIDLAHLVWRQPEWLGLALYPWLYWAVQRWISRSSPTNYAEPHLLHWVRASSASSFEPRRLWRHALLILAWLLFGMALAGPRIAISDHDQDQANYTELMVVLDLSYSMTARDAEPSRLERAKLELEDLISRSSRLKIGLVVYAARAHLMTPPTHDKALLRHYLQSIQQGLLPTAGSNLIAGIKIATNSFGSNRSAHAILLITDGELASQGVTGAGADEAMLEETVAKLQQQNIQLFALGLGTVQGAPLLAQQGGWLHYQNQPVISRLNEQRLQKLAELGNGRYVRFTDTDADWRKLYDQRIKLLQPLKPDRLDTRLIVWNELYQWPLALALLMLLAAHAAPLRRSSTPAVLPLLLAGFLSGWAEPSLVHAATASWQQRAHQTYLDQSYTQAKQEYARVTGYAGRMGEGSSAYQLGEYQQSMQLFTQAILDADNHGQRASALFNLANSHYRLEDYATAVELYQEVLRYTPDDPSASRNLGYAKILLKRQGSAGNAGSSARQGRGPGLGNVPEGTDIISGNLSLGDKDEEESPSIPLPGKSLSASELITQGIFYSRPVIQQQQEFEDPEWHYAATSVERILHQTNALKVDESVLWKRIFETEEGFPAPLESPREIPGTPPW